MIKKFPYFRSKPHLKNVASLPCQLCGSELYVQASHSNQAKHGKGRGIKASDEFTAALCMSCHYEIDQGLKLSRDERRDQWDLAHQRTVEKLVKLGLFPAELLPKMPET